MRYMTLRDMRDTLRDEANISRNVAHGVTQIDQQNRLLARVQEDLYLNYDWPHLQTTATKHLGALQRYAEYPTTFVFEGIDQVWWCQDPATQDWQPIGYGIGAEQLNEVDSDDGDSATNVQRWQNYMQPASGEEDPPYNPPAITGDTSNNMFEVWPMPTDGGVLRFQGKRALLPLDSDDQTSTLDGPLIVLHAAAEILARQKAEDASLKLQLGRERLRLLRLRQSVNDTRVSNLSGHSAVRPLRPGIDYLNKV